MQTEPTPKLQGGFSPLGIWAFSIGTRIGWGSFIVTCNAYLKTSGVLGTLFGMLVGLAVILMVTWNLQYMIRNCQSAGGIYTFARETCGRDLGFLAGWFVLLTYFAILWANIGKVYYGCDVLDTEKIGFRDELFYEKYKNRESFCHALDREECLKLYEEYLSLEGNVNY
jgi:hypothetical protein